MKMRHRSFVSGERKLILGKNEILNADNYELIRENLVELMDHIKLDNQFMYIDNRTLNSDESCT